MKCIAEGVLLVLAGLVCLSGCASNPAEGGFLDGIYGMSSGKYGERKKQKEAEYQKLAKANQALSDEQESLQQEKQALTQQEKQYERQLAELENEMQDLRRQLQSVTTTSEAQMQEKQNLEKQLANLNSRIDKADPGTADTAEMEAELQALKKEKEKLKNQILQLSSS